MYHINDIKDSEASRWVTNRLKLQGREVQKNWNLPNKKLWKQLDEMKIRVDTNISVIVLKSFFIVEVNERIQHYYTVQIYSTFLFLFKMYSMTSFSIKVSYYWSRQIRFISKLFVHVSICIMRLHFHIWKILLYQLEI